MELFGDGDKVAEVAKLDVGIHGNILARIKTSIILMRVVYNIGHMDGSAPDYGTDC
jgi:hypothetical protein